MGGQPRLREAELDKIIDIIINTDYIATISRKWIFDIGPQYYAIHHFYQKSAKMTLLVKRMNSIILRTNIKNPFPRDCSYMVSVYNYINNHI